MKGVEKQFNDISTEVHAKLLKEAMSARNSTLTEVKKELVTGSLNSSSGFNIDKAVYRLNNNFFSSSQSRVQNM